MLPTVQRDARVDEHSSVSSSHGADSSLSDALPNDPLSRSDVVDLAPRSATEGSWAETGGGGFALASRSRLTALSEALYGLKDACGLFFSTHFFSRSPSARTRCGKTISSFWRKKMLFLSTWMSHLATNWKATLRYVLGEPDE